MTNRQQLPQRRRSETFELPWGGLALPHKVTVGYYNDGRIGEVFLTASKAGYETEAIARDAAILISLGLQYGVQLADIAHAITRNSQNEPTSVIGAVIDELLRITEADKKLEGK